MYTQGTKMNKPLTPQEWWTVRVGRSGELLFKGMKMNSVLEMDGSYGWEVVNVINDLN